MRWRSPPEIVTPKDPTVVAIPSGRPSTQSVS